MECRGMDTGKFSVEYLIKKIAITAYLIYQGGVGGERSLQIFAFRTIHNHMTNDVQLFSPGA